MVERAGGRRFVDEGPVGLHFVPPKAAQWSGQIGAKALDRLDRLSLERFFFRSVRRCGEDRRRLDPLRLRPEAGARLVDREVVEQLVEGYAPDAVDAVCGADLEQAQRRLVRVIAVAKSGPPL